MITDSYIVDNLKFLNNLATVDIQLDYIERVQKQDPILFAKLVYLVEEADRRRCALIKPLTVSLPQSYDHGFWKTLTQNAVDCSHLRNVRLSEIQHLRVTNITCLTIDDDDIQHGLPPLDTVRTCFVRHPNLAKLPAMPNCQYLAITNSDSSPPKTRVIAAMDPETKGGICPACPRLRSLYVDYAHKSFTVKHVRQLIELTVLSGTLHVEEDSVARRRDDDDDVLDIQVLQLGSAGSIPAVHTWKLSNLHFLIVANARQLRQLATCDYLPDGVLSEDQDNAVIPTLTVILSASFEWTIQQKRKRDEAVAFPVGLNRLRLTHGMSTKNLHNLLAFFPYVHTLEVDVTNPQVECQPPYPVHTLILHSPPDANAWLDNIQYEELVVVNS